MAGGGEGGKGEGDMWTICMQEKDSWVYRRYVCIYIQHRMSSSFYFEFGLTGVFLSLFLNLST